MIDARLMTSADVAAFIQMVVEKSAGIDIIEKYNPNQPRNAHGEFASDGGGGSHDDDDDGGGGGHGGGGGDEESGGGGHGGGGGTDHAGGGFGHGASGHESGEGESGGGGVSHVGGGTEAGTVFVGPKGSVGEQVNHPTNGDGTIVAEGKGTVTVQHADGTTKQYAATTAPQKAKFVETGSLEGKTHIANVKVSGKGLVENKDDGKTVGHVSQAADGSWVYGHNESGDVEGGFSSKHQAVKALVDHNNEVAEGKAKPAAEEPKHEPEAASEPEKAPEPEKMPEKAPDPYAGFKVPTFGPKTYQNVGTVDGHNLIYHGDSLSGGLEVSDGATKAHIGSVEEVGEDEFDITHADGTTFKGDTEAGSVKSLLDYHNSTYGNESNEPKTDTESGPAKVEGYEKIGAIQKGDLNGVGNVQGGIKMTHTDSGELVGTIKANPDGSGMLTVTHADGHTMQAGSLSSANQQLRAYHNSKYSDAKVDPTEAAKPEASSTSSAASDAAMASHGFGPNDSKITANAASMTLNDQDSYVDQNGDQIGYRDENNGVYHADGTYVGTYSESNLGTKDDAEKNLLDYHNQKVSEAQADAGAAAHGQSEPATAESPKPAEQAPKASAGPPPSYTKAGTSLSGSDITVKKDGTAIDKNTGEKIGEVTKPGDGTWSAQHVSGSPTSKYNTSKKNAVNQLANAHNARTALDGIEDGESKSWSKDADGKNVKIDLGPGGYAAKSSSVVDKSTNEVVASVHHNPDDDSFTVTHVSGAQYKINGGNIHTASFSAAKFHENAVNKAEGEGSGDSDSDSGSSSKPAGKQPYESAGMVAGSNMKSSNVQKDATGKITGADITDSSGNKIGYTKANDDGTMDVYHADGTKVADHVKPGTGQATNALADHQNNKYAPKYNSLSGTGSYNGGTKAAAPGEDEAGKFDNTDLSEAEGGIHNNPESQYGKDTPSPAKTLSEQPGASALNLTPEEKVAIKSYTGDGYRAMNKALRTGNSTDVINAKINNLDKAFLKTPELDHTITTYRGIDDSAAEKLMGPVGSSVGKTFVDPGYGSTATYPDKAFGYQTRISVTIPPGAHVLRPDGQGTFGDKESELLLPRGSKFKVMSDQIIGNRRIVHVVVVGSAHQ